MKYKFLLIIGLSITMFSCKEDTPEPETEEGSGEVTDTTGVTDMTSDTTDMMLDTSAVVIDSMPDMDLEKKEVLENYADIAFANYTDAYNDALFLKQSIDAFVASPSDALFTNVKEAWLQSRESYMTTNAFRFSGGPIDNEDGLEELLNTWPLDENYIDYVKDDLTSGIINDAVTYPVISFDVLESIHQIHGDKDVSLGYHAIEFLLWGQDLTQPSDLQAGQRSYTDFTTLENFERRKQYLEVCAASIVDILDDLRSEWSPFGNNYRTELLSLDEDEALTTILTAIAELAESELAGEMIAAAYNAADQEEEQSDFSDNTHRDIILILEGVQNILLGSYNGASSVSGTSIADLLKMVDEPTYNDVVDKMNAAVNGVEGIQVPFDYAISNSNASGRATVLSAFTSLQNLGDAFTVGASKLGYTINYTVETVAN